MQLENCVSQLDVCENLRALCNQSSIPCCLFLISAQERLYVGVYVSGIVRAYVCVCPSITSMRVLNGLALSVRICLSVL